MNKKDNMILLPENAEDKYSMHTMTLSCRLTPSYCQTVKNALEKYTYDHHKKRKAENNNYQKIIKYFGIAEEFGFNTVEYIVSIPQEEKFRIHRLEIKINPHRLFHSENYPFVYIASLEDIKKCFSSVETMLGRIGIDKDLIKCFIIKRIDLCCNIDLGTKEQAHEYLQLLLKGAYPKGFKRLKEKSESGKRKIPTKNSFTVHSKNIEFALYDKYKQLKEEAEKYGEAELKEAEGKIRIELRYERQKVYNCSKKYKFEDEETFLHRVPTVANDEISRYIKMCYGSGNFVKLNIARKIVKNSHYRNKTKDKLLEMLDLVKGKHTLQDAKEILDLDYQSRLNKFNELGISPITLPKRSKYIEFKNPLYYIENCNCNIPESDIIYG